MLDKKNKRNGFSLIELLGVILILAIISTVTIVSIRYLINKSKENHYNSQLSNLLSTAKIFVGDNESKLPKNIGQKTTITLEELINNNYIEEVQDYEKEYCYSDKSYVTIFKYSKNKYSYYVYLSCPNYESTPKNSYNIGPEIIINPYEGLRKIEFKIKAHTFTGAGYSTTNKILSYKYILYIKDKTTNKYIETTNSGDVEASLAENITKEIKLTGPIPSDYKLEVTAVDIYGNVSTKSKEVKIKDTTAPICEIIGQATGASDWTNTERLVTVNCIDNESGCEKDTYTKLFTEEAKNGKIEIKDKAGNKTECSFTVNIDKTKPTCTIKLTGTEGNNGWYKQNNVNITMEKSDSGSGISNNYGLAANSTFYNSKTTGTQGDTTGVIWYGIVKDIAGNEATCASKNFKVDITAPTCTVSGGNSSWINASSKTTSRTITATCSDLGGSDCKIKSFSKKYSSNINTTKAGAVGNNSGGSVEDNAGNKTSCAANQTVKIDKNAPTCTVSGGNSNWINASSKTTSRTITATCSDTGGSDCKTESFSKKYTSDINTTKAGAVGNNSGGSVEDNAGNKTACAANQTVKIDKTKPTFDEKLHYCEPNETNEYYPFGYTVSDNLSDIDKATEKFYYCYNVKAGWPAKCGSTCNSGWRTATFTKKKDMIISAVSINCSTHDLTNYIEAKFEVCDKAGNCAKKGTDASPIKYNWETKCGF